MKTTSIRFFFLIILGLLSLSYQGKSQVVASFSSSTTIGCGAPISVTFTNNSTGATNYVWNFGNGITATNPAPPIGATYSTAGTYTVTLTASNGASSNVATQTITVFSKPTANFTTNVTTTTCIGEAVIFTDASAPGGSINNWQWDFGDGTSQTTSVGSSTHSYTAAGTFPSVSLMVTDTNGCKNSVVHSITVLPAPAASFTGNILSSCAPPLTVSFTNTSTASGSVSYSWDFGDTASAANTSTLITPGHTYNTAGTFSVRLIITQGGCIDTLVKNSYIVIKNIVADFSVNTDSVCLGQTVAFTDLSIPLSTTRTWDFGDGTTSSIANPSHLYASAGIFPVTLFATSSGCSDTLLKTSYVTVFPLPVVGFTTAANQSCSVPFSVNFTDTSSNAASWAWNFGDPASGAANTSTLQNPTHTFSNTGNYTITLIVTSANGCSKTLVKTNFINISPPLANFTATTRQGCAPLTVNFTSSSTSIVDPIQSYYWNFGDGNDSTTTIPAVSYSYINPGIYTDTLIITTVAGCKDTIVRTNYIKVGTVPTANFTIADSTVCFGTPAEFNDLAIAPADSVYWLFGDGANFSALLPSTPVTHVYGDTGIYSVTQIVYYNGCPDTLKYDSIVTILPPIPVFTFQLNCLNPYSVDFTDASVRADSVTWDFGDGTVDNTNNLNPTHVYLTRGSKTVTLTAYNYSSECSFPTTMSFTIAEPIAQFTSVPTIGCYPLPVTITNTSQDATHPSNPVLWSFGDGTTNSTLTSPPVHTYTLPGLDTLRLIITDINSCKDTISQTITVQGPVPFFSPSTLTGCAPLLITFTDSTVSDSALIQWNWNFGDPASGAANTSILQDPSHTYNSPGLYTVTLVVTDTNGCSKTLIKSNFIQPTFPFPAFTSPALGCKGSAINFNASASIAAAPAIYSWDFGDGTPVISGPGTSTTHSYSSDSSYIITLTIIDNNGCDSSIQHQILIQKPIAALNSITSEGCGITSGQFTDISTGASITSWQWYFGDGGSSTQQNPVHSYTSPGSYNISLVVKNSAGCTDSIFNDSLVIVHGPVGTFSITPTSGCSPLSVTFTAASNNSTSYTWDFGDGTVITTNNQIINHIYTHDIVATPILLLSNVLSNGSPCQLPAIPPPLGTINVSTLLNVTIDSSVVTLDQDEAFTINSTISNVSGTPAYQWSPASGLSCTTCQNPVIIGNGSGENATYILTVTDPASGGCMAQDSIRIIFPPCLIDLVVPNVFTPNADGINDLFEIKGACEANAYLIHIYDRWGLEIFSSENKNIFWEGRTTSGITASEGVYYYVLSLDGKVFSGFLQLFR